MKREEVICVLVDIFKKTFSVKSNRIMYFIIILSRYSDNYVTEDYKK
jgi:hypothetical protein